MVRIGGLLIGLVYVAGLVLVWWMLYRDLTVIGGYVRQLDARLSRIEQNAAHQPSDDNHDALAVLQDRVNEVEASVDRLRSSTTDSLADVRKQLAANRQATDGLRDALSTAVTRLRGDIESTQSSVAAVDSSVSELRRDLDATRSTVDRVDASVSTLQQSVSAAQSTIDQVGGKVTDVQQQLKSAQSKLTSVDGQVSDAQSTIRQISGNVTNVQQQLSTAQTRLESVDGRVSDNASGIKTLRTDLSNTNSQMTAVQTVSDNAKSVAQQASDTATHLSTDVQTLRDGQTALQTSLDDATHKYDRAITYIDDYSKLRIGYVKKSMNFFALSDEKTPIATLVQHYSSSELPRLYDILLLDNANTESNNGSINSVYTLSQARPQQDQRFLVVLVSPYLTSRRPVTLEASADTIYTSSPAMNLQLTIVYAAVSERSAYVTAALKRGIGSLVVFLDTDETQYYDQATYDTLVEAMRTTYPNIGSLPPVVLTTTQQYPLMALWADDRRRATLYAADSVREVIVSTRTNGTEIWELDYQLDTQFRPLR